MARSQLPEKESSLLYQIISAANPEQIEAVVHGAIDWVRNHFLNGRDNTEDQAAQIQHWRQEGELKSLGDWLEDLSIRQDHLGSITRSRGRPAKRKQREFLTTTIAPELHLLAEKIRVKLRQATADGDTQLQEQLEELAHQVETTRRHTRYVLHDVLGRKGKPHNNVVPFSKHPGVKHLAA